MTVQRLLPGLGLALFYTVFGLLLAAIVALGICVVGLVRGPLA